MTTDAIVQRYARRSSDGGSELFVTIWRSGAVRLVISEGGDEEPLSPCAPKLAELLDVPLTLDVAGKTFRLANEGLVRDELGEGADAAWQQLRVDAAIAWLSRT